MKRYLKFLLLVLLITSCGKSSLKYLQLGQYDNAINKAVSKLLKNPNKSSEIDVLSQAYSTANQKDNDIIEQLRKTGQPDVWDNIFAAYKRMQNRQEKVSVLQPHILQAIGYKYVNYTAEIAQAKNKAAEYFYAHAKMLLDKNEKYSARTAYDELVKLKEIYPNYKDVDELINKAYRIGLSYAFFRIQNNSQSILPVAFENELIKASVADFNQKWVTFHTSAINNINYDYYIVLNIRVIDISPESLNKNNYTDSKEIPDGWQYKLDKNGNVMKDSLGNDIKIPKYKTIYCNVTEGVQYKSVVLAGSLDFWDNIDNKLLKSDPMRSEWYFKNVFATAAGDLNALSEESKKKIKSSQKPFPPNADMIMNAGDVLKSMVKESIRKNSYLLK